MILRQMWGSLKILEGFGETGGTETGDQRSDATGVGLTRSGFSCELYVLKM